MSEASQITERAKSNLAFALRILPSERRDDAVVFYAFCRTLDDLADEPGIATADRVSGLEDWKQGMLHGFEKANPLQQSVLELRDRLHIPNHLFCSIIEGCQMDIDPQPFPTWEDLSAYIWKVACAVGLVSIRVFGCVDPASERYAESLGKALQLTNILRDIKEDLDNGGRIYLPLEDLARFDYSKDDLTARVRDKRFLALMDYEATRAEGFFREAEQLLPAVDHKALAPARIMSGIYQELLGKMQSDRFKVFEKRYRVSNLRKLAILAKHGIAG